jgi:hypothetical protein
MEWHLYKPDDFNTYPKIDCPMVVCFKSHCSGEMELRMCKKYITGFGIFMFQDGGTYCTECYYAYIGYVPSGYKTHEVLKCVDDSDCKIGCHDNGYCMYYEFECKQQRKVNEYSLEEKRIWKKFE